MKFTPFALAAALALSGATASATIIGGGVPTPAADNAEMLLVVWSPTTQSNYVQDLGLTLNAFRASGNTLSFTAAVTSIYSASTLASASDARWAVVGYDTYGDATPDDPGSNNLSLLTTVDAASAFTVAAPGISADQIQNGTSSWANWTALTNGRGTHPTLANGSSLVTVTDGQVYWLDAFGPGGNYGGNFAYSDGNAVGTKSSFYRLSPTDPFDTTVPATVEKFAGQWSFNGTSVSYSVGAVPEPSTYALLFAGLAAIGFMVRRRG